MRKYLFINGIHTNWFLGNGLINISKHKRRNLQKCDMHGSLCASRKQKVKRPWGLKFFRGDGYPNCPNTSNRICGCLPCLQTKQSVHIPIYNPMSCVILSVANRYPGSMYIFDTAVFNVQRSENASTQ